MIEAGRRLSISVLGSGTSVGVPTIGCDCEVCHSSDPRDQRLRPSIAIRWDNHCVIVDTGPDFRQQALRARITRIDAVIYTHGHADHILGLDDLRPFNFHQQEEIPVYAAAETVETIQRVFSYIFRAGPTESSRPRIKMNVFCKDAIEVCGLQFTPIPLRHGRGLSHGFRFGKAAYLTDHSEVPESSRAMLQGLDVLFVDALRHKPHPTHSSVEQALEIVESLKPRQAWFTHISHDLQHAREEAALPEGVHFAYDGLEVTVEA